MTSIQLTSKVDANGVLHISVPFGKRDADREVRVTVEPRDEGRIPMSADQWRQFVHDMAGCIDDPTFERHSQGVSGNGIRRAATSETQPQVSTRPKSLPADSVVASR